MNQLETIDYKVHAVPRNHWGAACCLFFAFRFVCVICAVSLFISASVLIFENHAQAATNTASSAFQQEAQKILRSLGAQIELPLDKVSAKPELEKKDPIKIESSGSWGSMAFGDIALVLFWIALAVIIVVLVLTLRTGLWSHSRAADIAAEKERNDEISPATTTMRMDRARLAADELAELGRFSEAMHVLLLQCLNEMRLRLDVSFAISLKSREILQKLPLPQQCKSLFAKIINRVEISYFGTHEPEKNDYDACRTDYEHLTQLLRTGGV